MCKNCGSKKWVIECECGTKLCMACAKKLGGGLVTNPHCPGCGEKNSWRKRGFFE